MTMDEAAARFWTTVFGGITAVGLIAGGIYTVIEYESNRVAQARNMSLQLATAKSQAQQSLLSKQLELCLEISDAAATLAASTDERERKQASDTFTSVRRGAFAVVEGDAVLTAVTNFENCLEGKCAKDATVATLAPEIVTQCRIQANTWNVDLPRRNKR
ncbi:MAG: hypothetical protein ABI165_00945 [Bryobacteraceae bacterium]